MSMKQNQGNKARLQRFSLVLLATLLFVACGTKQKSDPEVATVNGVEIRASEFRERLDNLTLHVDVDNFAIRKDLLETMIEEKLLLQEADRLKLRRQPEFKTCSAALQIDVMLNAFRDALVDTMQSARIKEAELRRAFARYHEKAAARHLFASTKEEADALYRRLQNGESFDGLAKEQFTDVRLASSGGYLGYFNWQDMDLAWSRAAQKQNIGEISKPVRTKHGYSIIKLEDRKPTPLLTEAQFLQERDKIDWVLQHRKNARAVIDYDRRVLDELHIVFDEQNLDKLYRALQEVPEEAVEASDGTAVDLDDEAELARTRHGILTYGQFKAKARYTSEKQRRKIRSQEDLQKFISGLLLRDELIRRAKAAGFDRKSAVRKRIRVREELFLINKMMAMVLDTLQVPETRLRQLYKRNEADYVFPRMVNTRVIIVSTRGLAEELLRRARSGEDFAELVRGYSLQKRSAVRGGEIGYRLEEDFGPYGEAIFALRPGEIAGPFEQDGVYSIFQVIGFQKERQKTFAEARDAVRERHIAKIRGDVLQRFFEALKSRSQIHRDLQVLVQIQTSQEQKNK